MNIMYSIESDTILVIIKIELDVVSLTSLWYSLYLMFWRYFGTNEMTYMRKNGEFPLALKVFNPSNNNVISGALISIRKKQYKQ